MIKEELAMRGRLRIKMFDQNGNLLGERQNNNKIVSSGRELVANLFKGNTAVSPVSYFGIGTDDAPTNDADDNLKQEVEIYSADLRKGVTISSVQSIPGTNQWKVNVHGVLTMAEANGVIIKEVGLFNYEDITSNSPTHHMYNRVVFQEIEKTSLFELQLFWEIIF